MNFYHEGMTKWNLIYNALYINKSEFSVTFRKSLIWVAHSHNCIPVALAVNSIYNLLLVVTIPLDFVCLIFFLGTGFNGLKISEYFKITASASLNHVIVTHVYETKQLQSLFTEEMYTYTVFVATRGTGLVARPRFETQTT